MASDVALKMSIDKVTDVTNRVLHKENDSFRAADGSLRRVARESFDRVSSTRPP